MYGLTLPRCEKSSPPSVRENFVMVDPEKKNCMMACESGNAIERTEKDI
jgi:hypothetical protein